MTDFFLCPNFAPKKTSTSINKWTENFGKLSFEKINTDQSEYNNVVQNQTEKHFPEIFESNVNGAYIF